MGKDERILLAVAFAALTALIIAKLKSEYIGETVDHAVTSLTYNQPSWRNAPFVASVIPNAVGSLLGVPSQQANAAWDTTGWA